MIPTVVGGRRGFSLVELLVGLVIAALVMTGMTRLFVNQSRLFGEWESQRVARDVVRGATEALSGDLRRIESTGGVEAASSSSISLRIPYAMGLVCTSAAGSTVVSLLPQDSLLYANATPSGYAWRTGSGYAYGTTITSVAAGAASACTGVSITTPENGRIVSISPGAGTSVASGTPVFLYQRVQYAFGSGSGGTVLTRQVLGGAGAAEIMAETLVSAGTRFRFYVDGTDDPLTEAPADLTTLRGFELALEGQGERPRANGEVASTELAQAVYFRNPPP